MRILITAVGDRTEHWTDLFAVLAARPEVELTVAVADVSGATARWLEAQPRLRHQVLPHLISEGRTGHMASVLFRPGAGRALAGLRPDVVHIIGEAAYLSTAQVRRWAGRYWPGIPITLYAAQNLVIRFPVPFRSIEQRAYHGIDHAFPITPAALDVLRVKGYRGPATIVPLGVDTDRFTPAPRVPSPRRRASFTVGFVGRLEPHKGVADLLAAVERIDANLVVVGRGSLSDTVHAFGSRRPGRVRVHEWVDHTELPALLSTMDVLALPSVEVVQRNVVPWIGIPLREQFGRVLVEAMACAVPVVGSDLGEIPHVVGPAGLIFPAGDPAALADCLATLRDDTALARGLGAAGRRRVLTEFGWSRAADRLYAVWHRLCGTAPPDLTLPAPTRPARPGSSTAGKVASA